ncbi:MAG TPA: DUF2846 domain-containing protein [Burkholderiales bacterium]|nr:DUF2846 domain-containing protein [Burkholderiales bacterium]
MPEASEARNADAKQFHTHPNSAAIYVYRPELGHRPDLNDSVLWMDGRLIGATLPSTFVRVDARPGKRVLHGEGRDSGRIALDTKAGELYFVSLNVLDGISHFERVPPDTGKRDILRCCGMMENWAPGQRPLLR